MKKSALFIAVFLGICSLYAQNDGLLWEISGNGLQKPSYLFGTIHIHCNPESIDKKAVRKAIKLCDTVAFELNLSDIPTLVAKYNNSAHDSRINLSTKLTMSEYKLVDSTCMTLLDTRLKYLDPISPSSLETRMMYSKNFIGCNPFPIDLKLLLMTRKAKKAIIGLESFEFQDSLINSIPIEDQVKSLLNFCRNPDTTRKKMQGLLAAYDSHKISSICNYSGNASGETVQLKVDSSTIMRNINWLNYLKLRIKDKSYFVAVGAAHLCNEQGLIALLRKEGYTLTSIDF